MFTLICDMTDVRTVVRFWLPLSSTWLMMAAEGPILASVVARLPEDVRNLAAYGVASSIAMLIESPVIGLLSAVITLARDKQAVDVLHAFMHKINWTVTILMTLVVVPWIFEPLAYTVIGLPADVAWRVHAGMVCMIPWPAAIGVRRFYQGLLIRKGLTRSVAQGTVVRLVTMSGTATILALTGAPGVIVGCAGLTAGVVLESIAIWWLAHKQCLHAELAPHSQPPLTTKQVYRFYTPLALTSMVSFLAVPLLSMFLSRLPMPLESLAVLPVISSLIFVFRSFGFSYQEVGIAFLNQNTNTYPTVYKVGLRISFFTTIAMVVTAFTPLLGILFSAVYAINPKLSALATLPTQLLVVVPVTAASYSIHRAVMIAAHRTIHVSISMFIEVGSMAAIMLTFISLQTLSGALASGIAIASGILLSTAYALTVSKRIRSGWKAP